MKAYEKAVVQVMKFLNPKRWVHMMGYKKFIEFMVLIVFILFFYGPLLHMFMLAFADTYEVPWVLPRTFGLKWWAYVLSQKSLVSSISLSFIIAFITTALSLAICLPAAYVLARYDFPGRKIVMLSFLLGNAFPHLGLFISMGIIFYKINLMGTFLGVLLIHMLGSMMLMIWLPAGAFRSIPRQQEEAARDAGAGPIRTFFHVTLPMAWPGIAVAAMFTFIASLGENQGTLLVGLPRYRTMPVEMYGVILDYPATAGAVFALILIIPNLILLLLLRKYVGADTISKGFKME
ncbi:ABC transporter permease [Sediminispirochaeta smaragdinae]|uniref:Binding-protein-dependent transport systems inner membrane component n=1 Tax=Sediminispirochaeta smaragdinae (strain DSM 11293 / JCM 15392 / SEBR 4228) TaxID=573413 RepID=E1R7B7_SEDSS|nr:ABC transporter permease subunit [Sediminispirochaeta smaragdinae]ADK82622.1 binding-protein-dependent transport systems inner membrane component [Sediminispirochaeta smaragdinae DSM 11293]